MAEQPVLSLKHITKKFGDFVAVHDINLDISDGEFLTIVGPSGSGKTTLIRILAGMDSPSEGEIRLRDRRIDGIPANERPTCMVFQSLALFPHRTVGQNIEFPLKIQKMPAKERERRAKDLLRLLRLAQSDYDKRVPQCSGGEKQRVALARALAFDPDIVFFDEPLSALDYRLRKTLEKELKDIHNRTGKTFVYITHSLEEAMVMSDRIAIMRDGEIEQLATAEEIYTRPVSRFVAEFMGEVNLFEFEGTGKGDLRARGVEVHTNGMKQGVDMSLDEGEKGTLVVRPEFMQFLTVTQNNDFVIRGRLQAEYTLGSRLQYEVEANDGSILTVEKLREDQYEGQQGDEVMLGWDVEDTHLIRGG